MSCWQRSRRTTWPSRSVGNVNIGLIFGLLQIVSTFTITTAYVWFADKHLDPISGPIREQVEGAAR